MPEWNCYASGYSNIPWDQRQVIQMKWSRTLRRRLRRQKKSQERSQEKS